MVDTLPVQVRSPDDAIAALVAEVRDYGERWLSDEWDFARVTLETARASRRLDALERPRPAGAPLGTVLLSPAPGDQHDFGVRLVALRLREAGWAVIDDVPADAAALLAAAAARPLAMIGLSVGHVRAMPAVAALVPALRAAARRPGMRVALGGAMLAGDPARAYALGADLHADSAEGLVAALAAPMAAAA